VSDTEKLRGAPIKQRFGRKQMGQKPSELVTDAGEITQLAPVGLDDLRILFQPL